MMNIIEKKGRNPTYKQKNVDYRSIIRADDQAPWYAADATVYYYCYYYTAYTYTSQIAQNFANIVHTTHRSGQKESLNGNPIPQLLYHPQHQLFHFLAERQQLLHTGFTAVALYYASLLLNFFLFQCRNQVVKCISTFI